MSYPTLRVFRCKKENCFNSARQFTYPNLTGDPTTEVPIVFLCIDHAKEFGFCYGCGGFYGGVESFDFGQFNLCQDCYDEIATNDFDEEDDDE